MKLFKNTLFILLLITILGGALRFYKLSFNPVSLTIDEVSYGYSAFSIMKTLKDENGVFLPMTFKSTGDYKNPTAIYLMVPSIAVFGLNEFGVRFPTALIATCTIPIFYLLVLKMTSKKNLSLIASFLLAISPWHIYFSRIVSDQQMAATFVMLGILFFLKINEKQIKWSVFSGFFFVLSMYTYHSEKLFIPIFSILILLFSYKKVLKTFKPYLIFIITELILVLPLGYITLFGSAASRASAVIITNDIEFNRGVALYDYQGFVQKGSFFANKYLLLPFFFIRKYLNYFTANFLFFRGLNLTKLNTYGLGVLNIFEIPSIFFGLYFIFKRKIQVDTKLLSLWFLAGIFPAALTNNEQSANRSLLVYPVVVLVSAIGIYGLWKFIFTLKGQLIKVLFTLVLLALFIWNVGYAILTYAYVFPSQKGEDFMEGTKETILYVLENGYKYDKVVFDPYRGVIAPYIVSVPHMYFLFYSRYDPLKYQTEPKITGDQYYQFDKYIIKSVYWPQDSKMKNTLFIGSPWSIPVNVIRKDKILDKVYMTNGELVFVIAASD